MTPEEAADFGDFLEEQKCSGEVGTKNARGDYTWGEILIQGQLYLAQRRSAE